MGITRTLFTTGNTTDHEQLALRTVLPERKRTPAGVVLDLYARMVRVRAFGESLALAPEAAVQLVPRFHEALPAALTCAARRAVLVPVGHIAAYAAAEGAHLERAARNLLEHEQHILEFEVRAARFDRSVRMLPAIEGALGDPGEAVSIGMNDRLRGEPRRVVCALPCPDDGTREYALLLAAIERARQWRLPVLFVCHHTAPSHAPDKHRARGSLGALARTRALPYSDVEGSEVLTVLLRAAEAIGALRTEPGPRLLEVYAPPMRYDPIAVLAGTAFARGWISPEELSEASQRAVRAAEGAVAAALTR